MKLLIFILSHMLRVAYRGASVQVPCQCAEDGKEHLKDRRPATKPDPYNVNEDPSDVLRGLFAGM